MSFKNRACDKSNIPESLDGDLANELSLAGIEVHHLSFIPGKTEVHTHVVGSLHGWNFSRAWCYWIAEGPGIPSDIAERLHADHGKTVRVSGSCACPSPKEMYNGFAVGLYHVDSQDGLNALAATLHQVANPPLTSTH